LIVFPEVFVPGTPIWIDSVPIWDADEAWFAQLVDQAVVVPGPTTERIAAAAQDAGAYVVLGVDEREPHGTTIYNTLLYFGPDGRLLNKHRKLMPTGSERTVWGMGDGSMLDVVPTELGRLGGLICWENYMPLARCHLYAQVVVTDAIEERSSGLDCRHPALATITPGGTFRLNPARLMTGSPIFRRPPWDLPMS
jgi:nitrilase